MSAIGKCSICLDNIQLGRAGFLRTCTHGFHRDCIARCLATSNQCPMCRCHASVLDIFTPNVDPPDEMEADVDNVAPNLAPLDLCDRAVKRISPEQYFRVMGNEPMDPPQMRKPIINCCGIKIQTAIEIGAILGMLCVLVLVGLLFATQDVTVLHFLMAFLMIIIGFLLYCQPFAAFKKGQHLETDKNGTLAENPRWANLSGACIVMGIIVALFVIQAANLLYILQRAPCESGKCPSWSNHCSKNFAQLFFLDPETTYRNKDEPYSNEGIVERVFETPGTARFLKRTILEMAANQTMANQSKEVVESELGPYFDDLDHLKFEMNCERYRSRQPVICPEKAAKLRQAFMDVFWAQVGRQWNDQTQSHVITDDEIDSAFVVPHHCDSIRLALALSIPFLFVHLAILVTFIRGFPMAKWLDWATTCPVECRRPAVNSCKTVEPCEHCPIRRYEMMPYN